VTLRGSREAEAYWHLYNLAGDPSLDPYTQQPLKLEVVASASVRPRAEERLVVEVTGSKGGAVGRALVGVTQNDRLLGSGFTDALGRVEIAIQRPEPGVDLRVVVTAHNHAPATAWVEVEIGDLERLAHEEACR
jgi:hypothetical protein